MRVTWNIILHKYYSTRIILDRDIEYYVHKNKLKLKVNFEYSMWSSPFCHHV